MIEKSRLALLHISLSILRCSIAQGRADRDKVDSTAGMHRVELG